MRHRAEQSSRHPGESKATALVAPRSGSKGTGALTGRRSTFALIPVLALIALIIVPDASAFTQRSFKETFGSVEQPSFGSGVVVDRESGDVLLAGEGTSTINRFHADGTPAPFEALGTNQIDGKEVPGKPCAEEPASCDKTPQEGIKVPSSLPIEFQMAIDESEGPTKGDIYLTQATSSSTGLVDIFAPDGRYLGQLTTVEGRPFGDRPTGVAVDRSGAVYVAIHQGAIYKFVPTAAVADNGDLTATFPVSFASGELGMGSGPTAGSLFVAAEYTRREEEAFGGAFEVVQLDKETGQVLSEFAKETDVREKLAVSPDTGNVLTGDGLEYETPASAEPIRVGRLISSGGIGGLAFGPSDEVIAVEPGPTVSVYGAPAIVPTVSAEPAAEVTGTRASLTGTVDPAGGPPITKCVFQYGRAEETNPPFSKIAISYEHEEACEGLNPTEPSSVHATISGLESDGGWYGYRLVAFSENGREESVGQTFKTVATVVTEPATALSLTGATLNGVVRPEGSAYSECFFEYGRVTATSFERKAPCNPGAAAIEGDLLPHEVNAKITGLQTGVDYRFRLVATNAAVGTLQGEELRFGTFGMPRIGEVQASGADQNSVTLQAKINPSGFGTSYRFEWGQTPAYGNLAPVEFEPFVGSGTEPILVKAKISGLAEGGTYHYRVVATSSRGVTGSPDHIAETLGSCGLPQGRCFELASRSEAGPVALAGESGNAAIEMHFQAATAGSSLAYTVEGGYPEATKAADVQYRAVRGTQGWTSTQLSPPIVALNERNDGVSVSSATQFLSNGLSCGVTESTQPLTTDPGMNLAREEGAGNLYRINPEGSATPYTGITKLPPENESAQLAGGLGNYLVAYASQDCDTVLFSSQFRYSGVTPKLPGEGGEYLYEWRDGTLRNAGIVPGPSGEVAVRAIAGRGVEDNNQRDTQNVVSEDGSRIFFTAERQTSDLPAEIGVPKAIFVREGGTKTRDVSLSETAVPDKGAEFQWATPDGSRVFFTANAGLTSKSNAEGTDLYEYDLETEELTDRSVTQAEGGAQVRGFIGASSDGSDAYFASANQLVPGSGNSRAQNVKAKSFSIYRESEGLISFVGTFDEANSPQVLVEVAKNQVSQVSPDGRYLLFESSAQVTGYENDGLREAYLYDADAGSVTCVSCRQDGLPSTDNRYGSPGYAVLGRDNFALHNELHAPQFLTVLDGEAQVLFSSPDPLAPGAVAGQNNVYEWAHDQVFRLASNAPGSQTAPNSGKLTYFLGAGEDGSDVYIATPETLSWEDGDQRISVYDARVGGGFLEPPAPPAPCRPSAEDSCQGPIQGAAGAPAPTSTGDRGTQNLEPKKKSAPKHSKKKHKKKSKHQKGKKGKKKGGGSKKKSKRQANGNRRAGK